MRKGSIQNSLFFSEDVQSTNKVAKKSKSVVPATRQFLNDTEIEYYKLKLRERYAYSYGDQHEKFVGELLSRKYPGDFMGVSSGGGDDKNDGIISDTRQIFQCYAPYKYELSKVNKKIEEDYVGAIEKWGHLFDEWMFAWCHPKADDPHRSTIALLHDLYLKHGKKIKMFDLTQMIRLGLSMSRSDLVEWLGPPPILIVELGFDLELHEIKQVCEAILDGEDIPDDDEDISPVPPTKLDYNDIPLIIREYIENGRKHAGRVRHLFTHSQDASLGDRAAQKFSTEYAMQRGRNPNQPIAIYWGLFDFIRHRLPNNSNHLELAAHAVLSYLFDSCDIFERPPEGWQGHAT